MNLSNTQYIDILVKYSDDMIKHMVFQKEPIESKAKNSYENIKYSLDLIEEKYSKENTKITLITSDFHMKRCMLLMAKFLDCSHYTGRIVKDGKTDLTHWQNTLYGKRVIFQEALLLSYYAKHQIIQDESIEILRRKHTI